MNHQLTQNDVEKMTQILGGEKTKALLEMATGVTKEKVIKGEIIKQQDPRVTPGSPALTEVVDPRTGKKKRLTIDILERMSADAQIGLGLQIISLPIMSLKPEVKHIDPEIEAFAQYEIDNWYREVIRDLLLALEYGFAVGEKVFDYNDVTIVKNQETLFSGRVVTHTKFKFLHPSISNLLWDEYGNDLGFKQTGFSDGETVPAIKAIRFTHEQKFGNPYGNARTRRAYQPWWWHDLISQFANRYFEDFALNSRKLFYPPNIDAVSGQDTNATIALDNLEKSRAGSWLSLPLHSKPDGNGGTSYEKSWDIEYLASQSKSSEFEAYLKYLDLKKLRGMFIPEKLAQQEGSTGSYGMLESLTEFYMLSEESLALDIFDVLKKQFMRPLLAFNFGPDIPDVTFVNPSLTKQNQQFLKDFFKDTMSRVSSTPDTEGVPKIDLEALANQLGVPLKEEQGLQIKKDTDLDLLSRKEKIEVRTFAKPRPKRGEWEKSTGNFEDDCEDIYDDWAEDTVKELEGIPVNEIENTLDARLLVLLAVLQVAYRESLYEGYKQGYGDKALSPKALTDYTQKLEAAEKKLKDVILPKLKDKLVADIKDTATDNLDSIELRGGMIAKGAGAEYWSSIHKGLESNLIEEKEQGVTRRVQWVLDQFVKSHCDDCLKYAGEYDSIENLPTLPGDGETQCGPFCRCFLKVEDDKGNWVRLI